VDAAPVAPLVSPDAAELTVLALERRLAEERAERENLRAELEAARAQLEVQADHQASAVARAAELVRLEGDLADLAPRAATAEAERDAARKRVDQLAKKLQAAEQARDAALRRIEELEREQPAELVEPLPRRVARPRALTGQREWSRRQRIMVVATPFIGLLIVVALLLALF
jgi:predicted  nucleic acid-binding Zn-ribbon protein